MTYLDNAIKLIIDYDYALENESIDSAIELIIHRAEAAEARAERLAESNRELSESVTTLRAEHAKLLERIAELEEDVDAFELERDQREAFEALVEFTNEDFEA